MTWKNAPRHDWASHGADGFRTLAMGWRETAPELAKPKTIKEIIAEMTKPRSFDAIMEEFEREQGEREDIDVAEVA